MAGFSNICYKCINTKNINVEFSRSAAVECKKLPTLNVWHYREHTIQFNQNSWYLDPQFYWNHYHCLLQLTKTNSTSASTQTRAQRRPVSGSDWYATHIIPMGRTDGEYAWFCVWFDKRRKKAGRRDPSFSFARRFRAHTTLKPGFVRRQSTFLALMWCIVHAGRMCIVGMCLCIHCWWSGWMWWNIVGGEKYFDVCTWRVCI